MKQSSNVPAFLSKLWTLVEEAHTNEFITWSQVGPARAQAPGSPPPVLAGPGARFLCLRSGVAPRPVAGAPVRPAARPGPCGYP